MKTATAREIYNGYRKSFAQNPQGYVQTGLAAYQWENAKRIADIQARWEQAETDGTVRLRMEPDTTCDLDDLLGDTFDPQVNSDIPPARLAREKQAEIDRINRAGVWGIIGEYKCPTCGSWTQADSCWGFIGDDWKDSGMDTDIMDATLDRLSETHCDV